VQALKGITSAIREQIAAHGLSITIVAKRLGIGRQTFSRKLNGHVEFSLSELTRLAEILGTTVADLMCRADQIVNEAVSSDGFTIQDKRSGVVVLQARRVDWDGGDAA
jgi:transcriptional regulator with XRE-family HTH domain